MGLTEVNLVGQTICLPGSGTTINLSDKTILAHVENKCNSAEAAPTPPGPGVGAWPALH